MAKKLTVTGLKKAESKFNERKKIMVHDNEYEVTIHTVFRESLIEKTVFAYLTLLHDLKSRSEVDDELIRGTLALLYTLILREFSNLPIPKENQIEELVTVSKSLLDTGIMKEVFDAYPKEELAKIDKKLTDVSNNMGSMIGEMAISSTLQDSKADESEAAL
ncbi:MULTISPECIES: hypothetical protein [Paenibacillus]|uniref:hypothetical protein n=1 Tax=Paenibacillus TaxID=44249 RepID=UPI00203E757C|nr:MULTISPECIES: hypothetical protein [Paenibacillus]MCM3289908.1 hypothetical protein [Paenibacillus sp. MER 180]